MLIRPARVIDVMALHDLILPFAQRRLMIRREVDELYQTVREFQVCVEPETGAVLGCVAVHIYESDLAELKCLAVHESTQGHGLGRRLVEAAWEDARRLGVGTVFTLTHAVEFFQKCEYSVVEKATLPQKIWSECVRCPAFPNCQETALVRSQSPHWQRICDAAQRNGHVLSEVVSGSSGGISSG